MVAALCIHKPYGCKVLEACRPAESKVCQQQGMLTALRTPAKMQNGLRKEEHGQQGQLHSQFAQVSVGLCTPKVYRACSLLALTSTRAVGCHLFLQVCEAAIPVTLHPSRATLAEAPAGMETRVRHIETCLNPCSVSVQQGS